MTTESAHKEDITTMDISALKFEMHPGQVAGHGAMLFADDANDGKRKLFKPIEKGSHEAHFYRAFAQETNDTLVAIREEFIPQYFGTAEIKGAEYIVLEDLTPNFDIPCMLDAKIGTRQYTALMSEKKRQNAMKKCRASTSAEYGIRICGLRAWNAQAKQSEKVTKDVAINFTREQLNEHFELFLQGDSKETIRHTVLEEFIRRVTRLLQLMKQQEEYRFYSASVLLLYNGSDEENTVNLKMIDFAHSFRLSTDGATKASVDPRDQTIDGGPQPSLDVGFILGLETLLAILEEIRQKHQAKA